LQYNPDEEKALCNVALAYIFHNNPDKSEKYLEKFYLKILLAEEAIDYQFKMKMGNSKKLIEEKYTWQTIAKELEKVYRRVLDIRS
jgi:glycosyltransferase involved in cell wall biosynthesis